jgi:hypothetical protein
LPQIFRNTRSSSSTRIRPSHSRLRRGRLLASPHRHVVALVGLLHSRVSGADPASRRRPLTPICRLPNTISAAAALALGLRVDHSSLDPKSGAPSSSLAKVAKHTTRFRERCLAVVSAVLQEVVGGRRTPFIRGQMEGVDGKRCRRLFRWSQARLLLLVSVFGPSVFSSACCSI